jgi:tetratricopeptide (TPR) repeat protein
MEDAKSGGKRILLGFTAGPAGAGAAVEKAVLARPEVAAVLGASFIYYPLAPGKGETPDLSKRYGIQVLPTFLFTDAAGAELDRLAGPADRFSFLALATDVAAGNHLAALREKVAAEPGNAVLQARLGVRLDAARDPEGRAHMDRAVALDPEDRLPTTVDARWRIALADSGLEGPAPAAKKVVAALAAFAGRYPDSSGAVLAHRNLMALAQRLKDEKQEEASLEFLIRRDPDAEIRNNLAWFLSTRGRDLDRALQFADQALKDEPDNWAYIDTRAECLSRLGRHDEAVAAQERALRLVNADTRADLMSRYELGNRLEEFRKKRDAAKESEGEGGK